MEVHPQKKNQPRLALARLLRWGEYGTFLAIIPGAFWAVISSQFVWVASPLTLSLWLNLLRRWSGDRATVLGLGDRQQDALHRYESVLVALKRDRSEFLLRNAAQLTQRDVPNFTQVLEFRLRCLDEKKHSLGEYLQKSHQALQQELEEVQELQHSHQELLQAHQKRIDDPNAAVNSLLEDLQQRVDTTQLEWGAYENSWRGIPIRLQNLEDTIGQFEQQQAERSDQDEVEQDVVHELWAEMEPQIRDRIASIQRLLESPLDETADSDELNHQTHAIDANELERQVDIMYQKVMAQLNGWEEFQWEQGYQLQRLNEKLGALKQSLEHTYQSVLEQNSSLEQGMLQRHWQDMDPSELSLAIAPDRFQDALDDLQQKLEQLESDIEGSNVDVLMAPSLDALGDKLSQLEKLSSVSVEDRATDDVSRLVTPLLQHLSDCDEKLSVLPVNALLELKATLTELDEQVQKIDAQIEGLRSEHLEDLAHYNELHVKLSMIRFKAEEFESQVAIELDQIPHLIDNNLRQRFPNLQFEKS